MDELNVDVAVIGSGPAGQKAAVQAAKSGCTVAVIERDTSVGGECVHRGTIPSKALRECAVQLRRLRRSAEACTVAPLDDVPLVELLARTDGVIAAHNRFIDQQLGRNGIVRLHGHASFVANDRLAVRSAGGDERHVRARFVVIAVGSRPRRPDGIDVDHEHILDSDSILSLAYLPRSLTILGGGVIASEYASIFASLGTRVTMIDKYARPLGFLDRDLTDRFERAFTDMGGRCLTGEEVSAVEFDGVSQVRTTTASGRCVASDKLLVALGRVARVAGLDLAAAGIECNDRGLIPVDENLRTCVPNVYAAGDVIGPPSLASCSMEQGRRAVCHALGTPPGDGALHVPMGIYTIPEISSVGLDEATARDRHGGAIVGRADFAEIARGEISGMQNGFLKMVADAQGRRLLGVQIVGDSATELVHIAQMALVAGADIDVFVNNTFNFPTLAEAYRVAALQIAGAVGDERRVNEPATSCV